MDNDEMPECKKEKYEVKEENVNGYDIFSNGIDNSTYDQLQMKSEKFDDNADETNNIVTENIFDTGIENIVEKYISADTMMHMSLFDEDFFTDIEDEMLAIKEGKFLVNEKDDSFFDYCDNNLNDKLQIKFKKCEDITKNTILDQLVYDEETKTVNESLFQ
ncbi:hypothetical protein TSAR_009664 [Trichomalopsis sarcophagae]|uniref:Uncharacterized protein n=1 Tax=Trichomalopsis sarcophagae TaxID=543379 RepID=A0A232ELU7_9HYME|nr:hypothetical protein TSAR_009664 [Trichomalopsis sarcophagae]